MLTECGFCRSGTVKGETCWYCHGSGVAPMADTNDHHAAHDKALNAIDELLGHTGSCPLDHSDEITNGSLWDCDHPECVALQRAAD